MGEVFEALMVILFGISWPTNIIKSLKTRTAKGTSAIFLILILMGYLFGIISKILNDKINYVFIFYIINFIMVFVDLLIYFRNKKLDNKIVNR